MTTSIPARALRSSVLSLLSCLFFAQIAVLCPITAMADEDARAWQILKANSETMLALPAYSAECRTTTSRKLILEGQAPVYYAVSMLKAEKPNLMRYERYDLPTPQSTIFWTPGNLHPSQHYASNGKQYFRQYGSKYRSALLDGKIDPRFLLTIDEPWSGFFASNETVYGLCVHYKKEDALKEINYLGTEVVNGTICDKVYTDLVYIQGKDGLRVKSIWFIGPDHLTRRCLAKVESEGKLAYVRDSLVINIQTGQHYNKSIYNYSPGPGIVLDNPAPLLPVLANGVTAPDFTATDVSGKPVKLADLRGKTVILDFWASWCGPCMQSMPHNQQLMEELRKRYKSDVVLLAVDAGEDREAFDRWIKRNAQKYGELLFVHSDPADHVSNERYKVPGIPTQFVIDKQGVIRFSVVGFDPKSSSLLKAVEQICGSISQ